MVVILHSHDWVLDLELVQAVAAFIVNAPYLDNLVLRAVGGHNFVTDFENTCDLLIVENHFLVVEFPLFFILTFCDNTHLFVTRDEN